MSEQHQLKSGEEAGFEEYKRTLKAVVENERLIRIAELETIRERTQEQEDELRSLRKSEREITP